MSSTLFKAVVAGTVTAGALFLPVTAAQAAEKHHPHNGHGFHGNGHFHGHRGFGFRDHGFRDQGFGFRDQGFGFLGDDWGFGDDQPVNDSPTVIIVNVKDKHHTKKHHAKPAPSGNAAAAGYGATEPATAAGYHKK
jgi:hypothetical protein